MAHTGSVAVRVFAVDLSRRQLLAAAALAPLSRRPCLTQPRFGLVTYMWGAGHPLPDLLASLESAAVPGVELRSTHAHGVEPGLSKVDRAEVRSRFADSPVTLVGLGSNERFDSPDRTVLARAVAQTTRFLELSHDVGSSGVKVKPDRLHVEEGIPEEETLEQIGATLRGLGDVATDLGQELRLEVHGQCAPLPRMVRIMECADHPAVRLCWNSNAQDLEGAGLRSNFELVRPWFAGTLHTRRLDGESYPVRTLFELLKETSYGGWVLLEQGGKAPADLAAALRTQRERFESLVGEE